MSRIQELWGQHVYWTRVFIISKAADLDDLEPVGKRPLQNPKDFAKLLTPIYGIKVAGRFEELFTQHLTIAADLLDAAKKGEVKKNSGRRASRTLFETEGIKMQMKLPDF